MTTTMKFEVQNKGVNSDTSGTSTIHWTAVSTIIYIALTINQQIHLYNLHLKHLKPLRHVSIFSGHHHGVSSFLAKVITYSRFSSFFVNNVLWQHIMLCRNLL